MTIREVILQLQSIYEHADSMLDKKDLTDNPWLQDMEALALAMNLLENLDRLDTITTESLLDIYEQEKEELREEAKDFQRALPKFLEKRQLDVILDRQDYFERHGKEYGLLQEFIENGICQ